MCLLVFLTDDVGVGMDAKRTVILRGDLEMEMEKGGSKKEDIARKYSAYFKSILHHNNGYFLQVRKSK